MTVRVQWDSDAAKTGLPDVGSDSKTYPNTATSGQVVITSEQDPTRTITVPFDLPLPVEPPDAEITPDKTTVDSAGDATERTITVDGTGFPASTAGTIALHPGAPGSGGTPVASTPLTTDATGAFTGIMVVVPVDQAAGDYHLVATVGAVVSDDTAITVTNTPASPAITPDKTEVDSAGDVTERTITVDGTGFPASTAGNVALHPGAPGSGGTAVVTSPVTSDASGAFVGVTIVVPENQEAGDYHLVATIGAGVSDDTAITVTQTPAEPALLADKTTVDAGGDETERTVTVSGTGFPASLAGRVSINEGPPGSSGAEVVGEDVTTGVDGTIAATPLVVPLDQEAGDYHIHAEYTGVTVDDLPLEVTGEPPLEPPTGLATSNLGPASVDLTWDPVDGAENYVLYYKPSTETVWMYAGQVADPGVTATVTNLTSDTAYDFAVATEAGGDVSERSATVSDTTIAGGAPLDQVAAAAGTPTATSVPLTWAAVTDAQSYQIRWRLAADTTDWAPTYGTEDGAATGTSMEGLNPDTAYVFGVRAIGDGTTNTSGEWSADVPATTATALLAARKRATRKKK